MGCNCAYFEIIQLQGPRTLATDWGRRCRSLAEQHRKEMACKGGAA